jgi:hypothetical protein
VLDRTGDTDGDVQLRRDDLAGLADLHVVGHETRIDRGARRADGGAQLVGNALEELEVIAVLHAAAAGDHHRGGGQFRTIGLGDFLADEAGDARVVRRVDG